MLLFVWLVPLVLLLRGIWPRRRRLSIGETAWGVTHFRTRYQGRIT